MLRAIVPSGARGTGRTCSPATGQAHPPREPVWFADSRLGSPQTHLALAMFCFIWVLGETRCSFLWSRSCLMGHRTPAPLRGRVPLGCTQLPRLPAACVSMEGQKSGEGCCLGNPVGSSDSAGLHQPSPSTCILQGVVSPRQGGLGPRGTQHPLPPRGAVEVRMKATAVLG